jgi:uncharacterized protein YdaU (DUF1376 family)
MRVNFYKHYIGDFNRDTAHLSLTERGAYLALIHHYYATEKPLPDDHATLCRIAGAMSKDEKAAVKVAASFFEKMESGLVHKRIEAELEKAGKRADTNRAVALEREERRRRARNEHESCSEREPDVARKEHHTRHQTPDTNTDPNGSGSGVPPCPHREIVSLYNKTLPELTQVIADRWEGSARAKALQARWRESPNHQSLDFWESYFGELRNYPFYLGKNDRGWKADLEWLVQRKNFDKLVEKFVSGAQ